MRTSPLGRPKVKLSLEMLRRVYRTAFGVASRFVDLEVLEEALLNSRLIEYPFVLQRMVPMPPGVVLDIGCTDGGNFLAPTLAALGWDVYGLDIRHFKFSHPRFHFVRGDIRRTKFSDDFFDCVYSVSTMEHIGLAGRYGVTECNDGGDFLAMREVQRVLKPGGVFFLTIPYGAGGIVKPLERIYNRERLLRLVDGWTLRYASYRYLDNEGLWKEVSEEAAGQTKTPGGVCIALLELINR